MNPNPTVRAEMRPRSQGANIQTWIGFKHLLYVLEEGILEWFRQHGLGPQRLLDDFGLMLEIIDCSALLVALVTVDDTIVVTTTLGENNEFNVRFLVTRGTSEVVCLRAKVQVAL